MNTALHFIQGLQYEHDENSPRVRPSSLISNRQVPSSNENGFGPWVKVQSKNPKQKEMLQKRKSLTPRLESQSISKVETLNFKPIRMKQVPDQHLQQKRKVIRDRLEKSEKQNKILTSFNKTYSQFKQLLSKNNSNLNRLRQLHNATASQKQEQLQQIQQFFRKPYLPAKFQVLWRKMQNHNVIPTFQETPKIKIINFPVRFSLNRRQSKYYRSKSKGSSHVPQQLDTQQIKLRILKNTNSIFATLRL